MGKPRVLPHVPLILGPMWADDGHLMGPVWANYGHLMGYIKGLCGQTNFILEPHALIVYVKGHNDKAENSNTFTNSTDRGWLMDFDGTLKWKQAKY